jgi:hypothetical protein
VLVATTLSPFASGCVAHMSPPRYARTRMNFDEVTVSFLDRREERIIEGETNVTITPGDVLHVENDRGEVLLDVPAGEVDEIVGRRRMDSRAGLIITSALILAAAVGVGVGVGVHERMSIYAWGW